MVFRKESNKNQFILAIKFYIIKESLIGLGNTHCVIDYFFIAY